MSTMQEQCRSGPMLPPNRSRRLFPKECKADAVALQGAQCFDAVAGDQSATAGVAAQQPGGAVESC